LNHHERLLVGLAYVSFRWEQAIRHVGVAAVKAPAAQRSELRPAHHFGRFGRVIAARVHDALCAGLQHAPHPHELALRRAGHDIGAAHACSAHQVAGRFQAIAMMFHVHPDAIKTQQADQLIKRRVGKVQRCDQHRFVAGQFGAYITGLHDEN
jgi:hypothetical protein